MSIGKFILPAAVVVFTAAGVWFMRDDSGVEPSEPVSRLHGAKRSSGRTNHVAETRLPVKDRHPGAKVKDGSGLSAGSKDSGDFDLLKNSKAELAAEKAITSEVLDLFAGLEITPERRKVYALRKAMDAGDRRAALKIIRDIMDSRDKVVRQHALHACAALGRYALAEITHMLADPDPSIAADAMDTWQLAFGEVEGEADKASVVVEMVGSVDERVQAYSMMMNLTRMSTRVALNAVTEVIEGNKGTVVEDVGRDMYEHLTGGDVYVDSTSAKRYLERKAEEAKVIAAEWKVFDDAVREGNTVEEAAVKAFGPVEEEVSLE